MAHYQVDDPRLPGVLDDLAARDTADWPAPSTDARATIARIFAAPANRPARPAPSIPDRRAA